MDPHLRDIDQLEQKINKLKREFDLFLAGRRRAEPSALRQEVSREVLRLTRFPFPSTAARFRMKTLAHRFQAMEAQLRNLMDVRESRPRAQTGPATGDGKGLVVDHAALERPDAVAAQFKGIHSDVARSLEGRQPPTLESLRDKLLEEARRLLGQPGVRGVRFSVVDGETGPKIRGEVLTS